MVYPIAFNLLLKSNLQPNKIDITIKKDASIGSAGEVISLPFDVSTLSILFKKNDWHTDTIDRLNSDLDKTKSYTVFDVGANVGLFSRQILNSNIQISRLHCVEPDHNNFDFLKANLSTYEQITEIEYHRYALGEQNQKTLFYRDPLNVGNYSLNQSAVLKNQEIIEVDVVSTNNFFLENATGNKRLIIKTDTQGFDEKIITLIPDSVWERVDFAIIELWGVDNKSFDEKEFIRKIEQFKKVFLGDELVTDLSSVVQFSMNNNRHYKDLILIR